MPHRFVVGTDVSGDYRSHACSIPLPMKKGTIGCPEMFVNNHQPIPRNILEEERPQESKEFFSLWSASIYQNVSLVVTMTT